jgi:hypothetical protein
MCDIENLFLCACPGIEDVKWCVVLKYVKNNITTKFKFNKGINKPVKKQQSRKQFIFFFYRHETLHNCDCHIIDKDLIDTEMS